LQNRGGPNHLSAIAHAYEHFDDVASKKLSAPKVACSAGCSHCCRQLVFVTPIEGLAMRFELDRARFGSNREAASAAQAVAQRTVDWINRFQEWTKSATIPPEQVIAEFAETDEHTRQRWLRSASMIALSFLSLKLPCPALDENGKCLLYGSRPVSCRAYWSYDALACERFLQEPLRSFIKKGEPIPKPPFEGRLREGLEAQVSEIGLMAGDSRRFRLPLPYALADPWRWFARWRKEGPVDWAEAPDAPPVDWPRPETGKGQ